MLASTLADFAAALTLLAAAVLLQQGSRLASLICLEVAFSIFLCAVIFILCGDGGVGRIGAHRRGGREHFDLDVARALRREA